jgi:DNA-binding NarL/FixJ family response regulator
MQDDPAARPSGAGVAVEILIEDGALSARIIAALRELPEIDLERAGSRNDGDAAITITDRIEALRHASRDEPVIVLTDRTRAWAALRAGAAGVLPRSAGVAELRLAIDATLHGLVVVPAGGPWGTEEEDDRPSRLTAREREVLKLLAEGASNKMIARRLAVSVHTAKFHVASILDKLDASGRTDAVAHAIRLGVLML